MFYKDLLSLTDYKQLKTNGSWFLFNDLENNVS